MRVTWLMPLPINPPPITVTFFITVFLIDELENARHVKILAKDISTAEAEKMNSLRIKVKSYF